MFSNPVSSNVIVMSSRYANVTFYNGFLVYLLYG